MFVLMLKEKKKFEVWDVGNDFKVKSHVSGGQGQMIDTVLYEIFLKNTIVRKLLMRFVVCL